MSRNFIVAFSDLKFLALIESLILAQDERWRRILGMQVERALSVGQEIFNLTIFNLQSSTNFQFSNIENWKIHCKLRFENWNFSPCGRGQWQTGE